MPLFSRTITNGNIEDVLQTYVTSAETVGESISGLKGLSLLRALKRGVVGGGPYPNVALFEAANRIMTDLVILYGVRWLLRTGTFPFGQYSVEYGHENQGPHDIMAEADGKALIGEAFNVAPSFFAIKKNSAIKKLRRSNIRADYKLIICNHDAVRDLYTPKPRHGEFFVFVNVGSDVANVVPNPALHPTAAGADAARPRVSASR